MVERSYTDVTSSFDSKFKSFGANIPDSELQKVSNELQDEHLIRDVQGIRAALQGNFSDAAVTLHNEREYVSVHPEARNSNNNAIVGLAGTMYAVSLVKLGNFAEAERVLKEERQLDALKVNKDREVIALNADTLREALLRQGKRDEAQFLDRATTTQDGLPAHQINKPGSVEAVAASFRKEIDELKSNYTQEGLEVFLTRVRERIAKREKELAELTEKHQDKTQFYQDERNHRNLDVIMETQTAAMKLSLAGKYEEAAGEFKDVFAAIDSDENIRKIIPDIVAVGNSVYGYNLLALSNYPAAEQRFRMEVERDRTGRNPAKSICVRLNQLGLEYALMRQGKYQDVAQLQNRIGVSQMPSSTGARAY